MVTRRFTVQSSDEEDESPPRSNHHSTTTTNILHNNNPSSSNNSKRKTVEEEKQCSDEEDESSEEVAKPIGRPIRVSGKGKTRTNHFNSFEFDGNQYSLEDPVLFVPEEEDQKPYVAIIKDITQSPNGSLMITGQWFYRPDEAVKKGGGTWQSNDTRELFYSFHQDEVPAESVMHKCVVHFVPICKHLPNRKEYPGFIVQKVYDTIEMKLWKLTDKDYEDNKQQEIDELVQKTFQRLGELPDIETDEAPAGQEYLMKNKRILKKWSISPIDVSREEETSRRSVQPLKPNTSDSEHYHILMNHRALTGDKYRDKGLLMLLQNVQYLFDIDGNIQKKDKCSDNSDAINNGNNIKSLKIANECKDKVVKKSNSLVWPDAAIPAVVALEKASHNTFASDNQKYSQKLRQLAFNLKNNAVLLRRLLNGELEPSKVLNMTYIELKEGLNAEEISKSKPDEPQHMQMTDARCKRCEERTVGVKDIISAGHTDRYMLECIACGHIWSASRDAVSVLTLDESESKRNVGTAPWATAKFENVEKKLASPRESDKSTKNIFMPVRLEAQKSFGKSRKDENIEAARRAG